MLTRSKRKEVDATIDPIVTEEQETDTEEQENKRVKFDCNKENSKKKSIEVQNDSDDEDNSIIQKIKQKDEYDYSDDFLVKDDYEESESESVSESDSEEESESDSESSEKDMNQKKLLDKIRAVDSNAYTNLKEVIEMINLKNPNIMDILKAPIRQKDRATIVELYEIFKVTRPLTEDWLDLRYKINYMLKKYKENYTEYSKYSNNEIEQIKNKSRNLKSQISPEFAIKYNILTLDTSEENKAAIYKKYRQYKKTNPTDEERTKLKNWLDCALSLPHNKTVSIDNFSDNTVSIGTASETGKSKITVFLNNVIKSLDEELYGMESVKEQLLLFLNSKLTNPNMKGCSLALVGPPGVGKTTIARYIAKIMRWPFEQISFGGANSSDFLKGHDYTYVGSKPGEIVRCLQRMKYKNGILFLDEYEKVSEKTDIASCLLHITDFQQNHDFKDNYLSDVKIDLSELWFIYSMNELPKDSALRDRLFVINVPSYKCKEKEQILTRFVVPKTLQNINIDKGNIIISEETAQYIIKTISSEESGIRKIEQITKDIVNKIHFIITNQDHNGKLPEIFNFMSFIKDSKIEKLSYPVRLTNNLFDILFKSINERVTLPFGMYL